MGKFKLSRWIGALVLLGVIGGVSFMPRTIEPERKKSREEIQITGDVCYPLSIVKLNETDKLSLDEIEHTGIEGIPSDAYCRANPTDYRYTIKMIYRDKEVSHSLNSGRIAYSDPGGIRTLEKGVIEFQTPDYGKPDRIEIIDNKTGESYSF